MKTTLETEWGKFKRHLENQHGEIPKDFLESLREVFYIGALAATDVMDERIKDKNSTYGLKSLRKSLKLFEETSP